MFRIFLRIKFSKFELHRTLELLEYINIAIKSEYVKSGGLNFFFESSLCPKIHGTIVEKRQEL